MEDLIDPDEEKRLQQVNSEIQDEVQRIFALTQNTDKPGLDEGKLSAEISHFIQNFQQQYVSVYDNFSRLKDKVRGNSSLCCSETGQLGNDQQFGTANDPKSDLNSEYPAAPSKISEADMEARLAKLLSELNIASASTGGKVASELSQRLEDLKKEAGSLILNKETALLCEENKGIQGLKILIDQLLDEFASDVSILKVATHKEELDQLAKKSQYILQTIQLSQDITNLELDLQSLRLQKNVSKNQLHCYITQTLKSKHYWRTVMNRIVMKMLGIWNDFMNPP